MARPEWGQELGGRRGRRTASTKIQHQEPSSKTWYVRPMSYASSEHLNHSIQSAESAGSSALGNTTHA